MSDLFGFQKAAKPARPWEGGERWSDGDEETRFVIFRRWDQSRPLAAWLMCNPSLAGLADEQDDQTVRRVCHFSAARGCGGFIGVNIVPLRTPYPADLWPRLRAGELSEELAAKNRRCIAEAAHRAYISFAAFGAEMPRRHPELVKAALEAFQRPHLSRLALGINPEGWPLHPLARGRWAIPNDRSPISWSPPANSL